MKFEKNDRDSLKLDVCRELLQAIDACPSPFFMEYDKYEDVTYAFVPRDFIVKIRLEAMKRRGLKNNLSLLRILAGISVGDVVDGEMTINRDALKFFVETGADPEELWKPGIKWQVAS